VLDGVILLLNAYLEALKLNARVNTELLNDFIALKKLWGSFEAVLRFFWNIGISNSNFSETFERLRDLFHQAGGEDEEFLLKIKDVADDRYSIEFQYSGTVKSRIQIMTAHAS